MLAQVTPAALHVHEREFPPIIIQIHMTSTNHHPPQYIHCPFILSSATKMHIILAMIALIEPKPVHESWRIAMCAVVGIAFTLVQFIPVSQLTEAYLPDYFRHIHEKETPIISSLRIDTSPAGQGEISSNRVLRGVVSHPVCRPHA
ncbi:hypothetical protein Syun_018557 [Stephania yunnanensis]|uniref:Uncharacterized protein n=1 Tax=Stephania yunnanensis TaxID=152371 RepID=A0AAP0NX53_9MAGN